MGRVEGHKAWFKVQERVKMLGFSSELLFIVVKNSRLAEGLPFGFCWGRLEGEKRVREVVLVCEKSKGQEPRLRRGVRRDSEQDMSAMLV